jgi:hypothetical protein
MSELHRTVFVLLAVSFCFDKVFRVAAVARFLTTS